MSAEVVAQTLGVGEVFDETDTDDDDERESVCDVEVLGEREKKGDAELEGEVIADRE